MVDLLGWVVLPSSGIEASMRDECFLLVCGL